MKRLMWVTFALASTMVVTACGNNKRPALRSTTAGDVQQNAKNLSIRVKKTPEGNPQTDTEASIEITSIIDPDNAGESRKLDELNFECSHNDVKIECTNPIRLTNLQIRNHRVIVKAVDKQNNRKTGELAIDFAVQAKPANPPAAGNPRDTDETPEEKLARERREREEREAREAREARERQNQEQITGVIPPAPPAADPATPAAPSSEGAQIQPPPAGEPPPAPEAAPAAPPAPAAPTAPAVASAPAPRPRGSPPAATAATPDSEAAAAPAAAPLPTPAAPAKDETARPAAAPGEKITDLYWHYDSQTKLGTLTLVLDGKPRKFTGTLVNEGEHRRKGGLVDGLTVNGERPEVGALCYDPHCNFVDFRYQKKGTAKEHLIKTQKIISEVRDYDHGLDWDSFSGAPRTTGERRLTQWKQMTVRTTWFIDAATNETSLARLLVSVGNNIHFQGNANIAEQNLVLLINRDRNEMSSSAWAISRLKDRSSQVQGARVIECDPHSLSLSVKINGKEGKLTLRPRFAAQNQSYPMPGCKK